MSTAAPAPPPPGPGPRRAPPPPVIAAPTTPQAPRLSLADATSGVVRGAPLRIVAYGVDGIGKTTLGANAPNCLVLGAEDGSEEISVYKRLVPTTWGQMLGILDDLATEQHEVKSVCVDTLDWLEPLCWQHVCRVGGKPSIEAFGYGKGYVAALDEWRIFLAKMQTLITRRKINIILLAHSQLKTFKNPDADQGDYDRYSLKLHDKASGLVREWAKAVLFCNYERATEEVDDHGRHKGRDTGRRLIYTRASAKHDAKNRLWLPTELTLSWAALVRAVRAGEELRIRLDAALAKQPAAVREQVQEYIESVDYDPALIAGAIDGLPPVGAPAVPTTTTVTSK